MTKAIRLNCGHHVPGFTIIEMIVAAVTVTVVMLGLIQVFRMATDAVSGASDAQEAYQQARGIFEMLRRDLAGLTKDGYLRIRKKELRGKAGGETAGFYSVDCLAFTSTGTHPGVSPGISENIMAPAAELVYTTLAITPGKSWLSFPWESSPHSIRKGILARQVLIVYSDALVDPVKQYKHDVSKATSLMQLQAPELRYGSYYIYEYPYSAEHKYTSRSYLLDRILATRVGEFRVEYLPDASDTWIRGPSSGSITWAGSSVDWPRALRITVVIFGPEDNAPPAESPNFVNSKFRGYVFQEIFDLP